MPVAERRETGLVAALLRRGAVDGSGATVLTDAGGACGRDLPAVQIA
jgi:hypothetical protein